MAILYAVSLVISFSLLFSFNGVTSVPLLPPNGNFVGTESISTPDQPSSSKETPYTGSGESSGVSPQEICASNSNVNPLYQDAILNNITSKLGTIMSPLPKIWDIITDYSNSSGTIDSVNNAIDTGDGFPKPNRMKSDYDCSTLFNHLNDMIPIVECYFDLLTFILGNMTYEVTRNKSSIWFDIRQLVYEAYSESSVVRDMKILNSTFNSCHVVNTTRGVCNVRFDRVNLNINCLHPHCDSKNAIRNYALVIAPIHKQIGVIKETMGTIQSHMASNCGGNSGENDGRRRRG